MVPPNFNNVAYSHSFPRTVFERRIFCGVCGEMMLRTSLRRHSPERALYCPKCFNNQNSPGYKFRYPFNDLIWETYKVLHRERRKALKIGKKIEDAYQNGKTALVDQFYKQKMAAIIENIRQNTIKMNQLFLDIPLDEPFSLETAKIYLSLQNQATLLSEKLAFQADALLDFYDSLSLNNPWYLIFSQLPEDFTLTAELSRKTISTISLTPEQKPIFNIQRLEDRTRLLDGLNHIAKIEQRLTRKESYSHDE